MKRHGRTSAVGKVAKPAKTPTPTQQHLQQQITHLQHQVASLKHGAAGTAKHKHKASAKHGRKRGLALGDSVACCAAEAVAMSLRLAGWPVSDADVLDLYSYTASGPDDGASIEATLEAAARFGLAGVRPGGLIQIPGDLIDDRAANDDHHGDESRRHGLILGVDLPGAHTVLATDAGWWSWGELHDPAEFPGAVIEEAHLVRWAA